MSRAEDLERIRAALEAAARALAPFSSGAVDARRKAGGDPVTEADVAVNELLRRMLPRPAEGWLSEETTDDPRRLERDRVWVVDPLDGTREFVDGTPEWCVSIGLVERGRAVAGGILAPPTGQLLLGALDGGVTLNGRPYRLQPGGGLQDVEVLASRSEVRRGEWERYRDAPFRVRPTGSVAFKLAQVAAGLADATWTLTPKHEWDVAGGVALVAAAGGEVWTPEGAAPHFNRPVPRLSGLFATRPGLGAPLRAWLARDA
jgi:myo-inositol-1(or 4)-monophosphatase